MAIFGGCVPAAEQPPEALLVIAADDQRFFRSWIFASLHVSFLIHLGHHAAPQRRPRARVRDRAPWNRRWCRFGIHRVDELHEAWDRNNRSWNGMTPSGAKSMVNSTELPAFPFILIALRSL